MGQALSLLTFTQAIGHAAHAHIIYIYIYMCARARSCSPHAVTPANQKNAMSGSRRDSTRPKSMPTRCCVGSHWRLNSAGTSFQDRSAAVVKPGETVKVKVYTASRLEWFEATVIASGKTPQYDLAKEEIN